jgi:outer membrane protein assembly factor BamB
VGIAPPPPAVTQSGAIVVCVGSVVTAFDTAGAVQWQAKLPVDGSPLSPTVVGSLVIIAVYGAFVPNVLAFDAASGAPVWNFTSHGDIETPVAVGTDGTLLVSGACLPALVNVRKAPMP